MTNSLVINTSEDISDFKFFLDFSGDFREIVVKSNSQTVINQSGGGVRYSKATNIAIPQKSLNNFPAIIESTFEETGKEFFKFISEKKLKESSNSEIIVSVE